MCACACACVRAPVAVAKEEANVGAWLGSRWCMRLTRATHMEQEMWGALTGADNEEWSAKADRDGAGDPVCAVANLGG